MNKIYLPVILVLITVVGQSNATEQAAATTPVEGWGGEAEIGILMTRGNTDTTTQNIKLGVHYHTGAWEHKLQWLSLRSEESGVVSAERTDTYYRSTYNFSRRNYAYGSLRHENDRFAGFNRRDTEIIGYGYKLYNEKPLLWDLETGVGARQTDYTDNTDSNEGIVRLATKIEWLMTQTSSLKQELYVESGSLNTATQSTTSLKVKINSSLAMKLSVNVQNNSEVPVGTLHTDTVTALTLVYDI
jgi:putative salt-induced outer membrane protein